VSTGEAAGVGTAAAVLEAGRVTTGEAAGVGTAAAVLEAGRVTTGEAAGIGTAAAVPEAAAVLEDVSGPAGPLTVGSSIYDPSTSAGQLHFAFKRAMVAVRRLRGRESQRVGQLSFAQYGLLHGLAGNCELSARELAEQTDLSPATVTQMLDHLEASGLVARTRSAQDRRVVLSVLTERGAAVLAERQAQMEPRWRAALDGFSEEELMAAARVLDRLADYFDVLQDDGNSDRRRPPD
jgi:DNA-binding MarR family transcriptional regulator